MELKKKLGARIQELRVKKGLTQARLAECVGIAAKHQSCIENGKNYPSAELIEKYAKVFEIDDSDVLAINHIKDVQTLASEINEMIKNATDDEIILVHKVLKSILH